MKRTQLRSKSIEQELALYHHVLSKKDSLELLEEQGMKIILINKNISFFYFNDRLVPTLRYLLQQKALPEIIVDMGAIRFLVNGADVMRPGIIEIAPDINQGQFVVVIDINNKKPIMVGIALYGSAEMQAKTEGKMVQNIHHIGDDLWKINVD